jgi:hypothetical protein
MPRPDFMAEEATPKRHTCSPRPTPPLPTAQNPASRGAHRHFRKAFCHAFIHGHTAAVAHLVKKMVHKARRRGPN